MAVDAFEPLELFADDERAVMAPAGVGVARMIRRFVVDLGYSGIERGGQGGRERGGRRRPRHFKGAAARRASC